MDHQVVRVYATSQAPDYDSPWQTRSPSGGTGSGVMISKREILTGAHVVANGTFLQVQKFADPNKITARVKRICHDCDLALLEVDEDFCTDGPPATIGDLPALRDKVSVVGFPIGGEEVSVTEGVVSRVEIQRYSHSQRHLLATTVDAAINEGNSGGPVFGDGKVVGIAFQKLSGADNIGEMVPAPLIKTFLRSIKENKPSQVPGFGIVTQNLENKVLRDTIQLPPDQSGVLIVSVEYGGSGDGVLNVGDALLSVSGHSIANNGTIYFRNRHRTRYDVTLAEKLIGETVDVEVLREGKVLSKTLTLQALKYLVPRAQYDNSPEYFVYGGLVFQPLTRNYLNTWDTWWEKAPKEFLHFYYSGGRKKEQQEVVVLTQILADELNVGYDHLYNESIIAVNGTLPRDLAHFVELIEGSGETVNIETSSKGRIVLRTQDVAESTKRIKERYRIGNDRHLR